MGQREVKGLARETKRVHGKELLQNKATSEHTLCTGNCEGQKMSRGGGGLENILLVLLSVGSR